MLDQLGAISMLSTAVPFLENRKKDSKKTRFFFCARAHRRRPSHVTPARQRGKFFFQSHFSFKKFKFPKISGNISAGKIEEFVKKCSGRRDFRNSPKFSEIAGEIFEIFRNHSLRKSTFSKIHLNEINVCENQPQ